MCFFCSQVVDIVTSLEGLTECDLRGNAVSRQPKYFERTVTRSELTGRRVADRVVSTHDVTATAATTVGSGTSIVQRPTTGTSETIGVCVCCRLLTCRGAQVRTGRGLSPQYIALLLERCLQNNKKELQELDLKKLGFSPTSKSIPAGGMMPLGLASDS